MVAWGARRWCGGIGGGDWVVWFFFLMGLLGFGWGFFFFFFFFLFRFLVPVGFWWVVGSGGVVGMVVIGLFGC